METSLKLKREFYWLFLKTISEREKAGRLKNLKSGLKIDLVIPVAKKDLAVLPYVIRSARKFIRHPIGKIFIIGPEDEEIRLLAQKENCEFVEESQLLALKKSAIDYEVNGEDRRGWLFQQLLKLGAQKLGFEKHFLVLDADTIFIRPHVFFKKGKTILYCSHEYHKPYLDTFKKLLGYRQTPSCLSFVSHSMLLEKTKLAELKKEIEKKQGGGWIKAILKNIDKREKSSFSEYETYGNFVLANYPDKIKRRCALNLKQPRSKLKELKGLEQKFRAKYDSISFHTYEK